MRHNPHPFHIRGLRVTILQGCPKADGSFATVMDYFWREDTPWLVLKLPDGRRTAAPATWTDLPTNTFPVTPPVPVLSATALLQMARLCQQLRPRRTKGRKR